jgi:hypothetical protein
MMKERLETRGLVDVFVSYSAGLRRLDKKIEKLLIFTQVFDILSFYQFYESLPNNPQTHQQSI